MIKQALFFTTILAGILALSIPLSFGASIHIGWKPNSESDLAGYRVYYGTSPGSYGNPIDVGNVTEYELAGLVVGTTYFIALTAYDLSGNESEKSAEVSGMAREVTTSSTTTSSSGSSTTTTGNPSLELQNGVPFSGSVAPLEEDLFFLDVPPGQESMQVELSGNPDADLYVQRGTPPSTALWDCRPYREDSNELCSFSQPAAGRWYIAIRGYVNSVNYQLVARYWNDPSITTTTPATTTGPTTTTSLHTTTLPGGDTTPPTGYLTINGGAQVSYSRNVILQLAATDDNGEPLNKQCMMSMSNDQKEWSDPEPFTTGRSWILTEGEGLKTVYVLFSDQSGNWMKVPAQDSIIYEQGGNACNQPNKLQAASIAASSELLPFFSKENAIDGDPSTTWSTPFRLFQKSEYYTVDLGEIKNISWLSMYSSKMFGTDLFPSTFSIQGSKDNINWEEMKMVQAYSHPPATSAGNWQFNGLSCRYLRVSIPRLRPFFFFFKAAQIAEIEVYGCDPNDTHIPLGRGLQPISERRTDETTTSVLPGTPPGTPGKPTVSFGN